MKEVKGKCRKCGEPVPAPTRRVCDDCRVVSPAAQKRARARERLVECPEGKRWCSTCDEFLPPKLFRTPQFICIPCQQDKDFSGRLKREFGITVEDYNKLLASQDGKCAICKREPKRRRLHVDHNHKTKIIRGLLCLWCNHRLLGGARESIDILYEAIHYLNEPPAHHVIGAVQAVGRKRKSPKE